MVVYGLRFTDKCWLWVSSGRNDALIDGVGGSKNELASIYIWMKSAYRLGWPRRSDQCEYDQGLLPIVQISPELL